LVDPSALLQMQEELNSPAAACDFARDFARIWEKRFARLAGAIASGDQSCRDAILSVKTASIMVGAARLACLAAEVEDLVRQPGAAVPETLLRELEACGLLTIAELEATFLAAGR
jgi:HPt (histidine-containing phosphotransfer) domain-containing protein